MTPQELCEKRGEVAEELHRQLLDAEAEIKELREENDSLTELLDGVFTALDKATDSLVGATGMLVETMREVADKLGMEQEIKCSR